MQIRRLPLCRLVLIGLGAVVCYSNANACGGRWDVMCNAGHAVSTAAQQTSAATHKAIGDGGAAISTAAQQTGAATHKAIGDGGAALSTAAQQTGAATHKAIGDTGKTIEKATHDTGHALEKAGQDVGHLLKQLTNFSLACNLPQSRPASLQQGYRASCGSAFSTYANDVDVCNYSGGASLIAAAAGSTILSAPESGGATYVLAKIAFELCQKACSSQDALESCQKQTNASAGDAASKTATATAQNKQQEERLKLFNCVDDGYAAEKLLSMDSILVQCEADKTCNSKDPKFSADFVKRVEKTDAEIDQRREAARVAVKNGKLEALEYGPNISRPEIIQFFLSTPADESMQCRVKENKIVLHIAFADNRPRSLRIVWIRSKKIVSSTYIDSKSLKDNKLTQPFDLTGMGAGVWNVRLVGINNVQYASYGFVDRVEP